MIKFTNVTIFSISYKFNNMLEKFTIKNKNGTPLKMVKSYNLDQVLRFFILSLGENGISDINLINGNLEMLSEDQFITLTVECGKVIKIELE